MPAVTATRLRRAAQRLLGRSTFPDTGGHELGYWQRAGLAKGTSVYERYLELFGLRRDSLRGQSVADFGCGPFGGVLVALRGIEPYPLDVLAEEYNRALGRSPWPILPVRDLHTPLTDGACDAVFCTNALDHVPEPDRAARELARIVKPGGRLYLHLHLRRADQLNKAHRYVVSEGDVRRWFAEWFDFEDAGVEPDWPNEEPDLTMFHARLVRRA